MNPVTSHFIRGEKMEQHFTWIFLISAFGVGRLIIADVQASVPMTSYRIGRIMVICLFYDRSHNNMYRNLFRSEVNIDQGIKEAVNSDQFLKP